VHPLDGGGAGVLHRSVEQTAAGLGRDGSRWQLAFGYPAAKFDALSEDIMRPLLRFPHHPLMLARFGAPTVLPASAFARLFRTEEGRALFGGVAAHAFRPLHYPMTSAIGMGIIAAGHRHGWAVAEGGSQSITNAMVGLLGDLGGKIETGVRVKTASQLPPADVTIFDLAPSAVAAILEDRLPRRISRAYTKFRRGPGAFKVDFAVEGGVPWTNPDAHWAGTVHLAGTYAEVAATERDIHAGRMPERPFVLIGQQYLADPQRSVGNVHPVWTYAHVPNDYSGDATEAIITQIERFAPGFRERIVGSAVRSTKRRLRHCSRVARRRSKSCCWINAVSAASLACAKVSAITTATGSPTWHALPLASAGCGAIFMGEPSLEWIIQPQMRFPILSAASSAPVSTARTPGVAAACAVSTRLSRAWAWGERTKYAWAWPGRLMSSV